MQPNGQQPNNQAPMMPQHVPMSQLKEQLNQQNKPQPTQPQAATPAPQPVAQNLGNYNQPMIIRPSQSQPQTDNPTATANNQTPAVTADPAKSETPATESNTTTPQQTPAAANSNPAGKPVVNTTNVFVRSLIILQMSSLAIIVFGFYPAPLFLNTTAMISGALMMGLGIFLGVWAILSFHQKISPNPIPRRHSFLVTGGPYKYMRHPMYATLILSSVGLTLVYPSITRIIGVLILILVLISKINIEEYLLAKRYHHYARYQRITGKMIPKFKKPDIDLDIDLPRFE